MLLKPNIYKAKRGLYREMGLICTLGSVPEKDGMFRSHRAEAFFFISICRELVNMKEFEVGYECDETGQITNMRGLLARLGSSRGRSSSSGWPDQPRIQVAASSYG